MSHPLQATITASLNSSLPSPQLLGTPIKWKGTATDSNPNPITYKFEVAQAPFTTFHLLQDFDLTSTFIWAETYVEGQFEIRLTTRDYLSGETAQVTSPPFQINSRVTGGKVVVTATQNPLVALFSAPTCAIGQQMRVQFQRAGAQATSYTDFRACHTGSMNFYVAGMTASTTYNMTYQLSVNGTIMTSPQQVSFTTGTIPTSVGIPNLNLAVPATSASDQQYKISLSAYTQPLAFAANLAGEVVWYAPTSGQLVRTYGQTLMMLASGLGTGTGFYGNQERQQILREFDLAGNIIRQTSADRVSEQLTALGTDPLGRFNHDAIRLPNGHTIALGDAQRVFPPGTQGSTVPIDIIAEVVMELDENFQVVWFWNAFDHDGGGTQLDIDRASVTNVTCVIQSNGLTQVGCPPALLPGFTSAADWLHCNSVQQTDDGNLILSLRDQDWIIKIDYENGAVQDPPLLWRMGREGDFQIISSDSYPWFSGQHQPQFSSHTNLGLFDNGALRVQQFGGDSRGMAFTVDEPNRVVTTTLSADLGVYSEGEGSAQLMPNGNYQFQPGYVNHIYMESLEVTPAVPNPIVFNLQVKEQSYRTFRMPDMYTVPYGTSPSTISY